MDGIVVDKKESVVDAGVKRRKTSCTHCRQRKVIAEASQQIGTDSTLDRANAMVVIPSARHV
jgi:hypothetical protein